MQSDNEIRDQLATEVSQDYLAYILSQNIQNSISNSQPDNETRQKSQPLSPKEKDILKAGGARFTDADGHGSEEISRRQIQQLQNEVRDIIEQALTLDEVAQRLSASKEAVLGLLANTPPGLYTFKTPSGVLLFPRWQFTEEATLPHLQIILQNLGPGVNLLTLNRFMTTENGDLLLGNRCLSPRDWLASGHDPSEVEILARDISG
ncbi:hypothetical protein [Marinobacter nauticus]|uniref:Uncharacterized protein n=1 Tax=Marinobacter nauticus TaxID=2743 RepID=A0A368UT52_MARNT|nr:hypothetical protein [Marinobacter nauticus]RBP69566.1 hypothetical protein DET64_1128 [Marinobacter nauticus]RCW31210.1 hypothetical protein DET51_1128 [Marinobacter nauticus]